MRRLIVTLDNTLDQMLKKYPNQAEIVRKALYVYHGDITTDKNTLNDLVTQQRELCELVEKLYRRIEELASR